MLKDTKMRSIHLAMLYQDYKETKAGIYISYKDPALSNIYTRKINQYSYKDTLEKCLKQSAKLFYEGSKNSIFQQDGATAHIAHSIQDWFNEKDYKVIP